MFRLSRFNPFKRNFRSQKQNYGTITYHDVKKSFLAGSAITKIFSFLTVAFGGLTVYYYVYDWQNTAEKQLETAKHMLNSKDASTQKEAFKILSTPITKRVFSGPVGVPIDPKSLITDDMVEVLVKGIKSSDSKVSFNSLLWLYKLASLSYGGDKAKNLILKYDPGLESISSCIIQDEYYSTNSWVLASQLALLFGKQDISVSSISKGITSLANSGDALALATAASLSNTTGIVPDEVKTKITTAQLSQASNQITLVGYDLVHKYSAKPEMSTPIGPTSNLQSIFCISLFSGIWGTFMWHLTTRVSPIYSKMINLAGAEKAKELRLLFLRNRAVGRGVFFLLCFDYFMSLGMQYTSGATLSFNEDFYFQTPENWQSIQTPMSSAYPLAQATLFALGTLFLVQTQRFVMVPLIMSGLYFNRDLLKKFEPTKEIVEIVEIKVKEIDDNIEEVQEKITQITK